MSVYRIVADVNQPIASPYVQSFDLIVHNMGTRSFEALLEVTGPGGIVYRSLCGLQPDPHEKAIHVFQDVATSYSPFELRLISNIFNAGTLSLELIIKNGGVLIARFSHLDFEIY
ncbi:hypothetical protein ACFOQM_12270 [Paenibacillus sp. GCM10012307]|uniref:Uncharacterized protein n=1 Tax=Paenibacillus roseus TaxID=2798579 RepID=A0A934MPG9_9BACL|nr:hypothetical protein [Paenibacillus roseus]MBJ6362066.1 hypothetical protein [Paenibacillus roseus]